MKSMTWFAACFLSMFLVTLSPLSFAETKTVAITEQQVVHLNNADASTLASVLKGVGKKRAQAIILYRKTHGPFKSVDDLTKVKGISAGILKKNIDKIKL